MIDVVEGQWRESHPTKVAQQNRKCNDEKDEVDQKCQRQFMACLFLHSTNCENCSKCIEELNDMCLSGSDNHPKSIEEAMTHLSHCMDNASEQRVGMSFVQMDVECCCCHEHGHIAANCPKLAKKKEAKVSGFQAPLHSRAEE